MNDAFNIQLQNLFQGSPIPFTVNFWVTPPVNGTGGTPNDVQGWTFLFTWKENYSDPDVKAIFTKDWIVPTGTAVPSISWEVPAAITSPVAAKTMTFWDLKAIPRATTEPQPCLAGTIYLSPTVTQRLVASAVLETWTSP